MITINAVKDLGNTDANGNSVKYCEGSCLSSDTKPINWDNGSKLVEMDTGVLYLYDRQNAVWRAWT